MTLRKAQGGLQPAALLWSDIEAMYQTYRAPIYRYVARKVCQSSTSPELAEDLTAETFLRAIEAICRGHGPTEHLSGWLHRIAHNLIVDYFRKRNHQPPTFDFDDARDNPARELSPYDQAVSTIGCEVIREAVGRLTNSQATIVVLQAEGCTGGEMAAAVGVSATAAKAMLHRGRTRLKDIFVTVGYEP